METKELVVNHLLGWVMCNLCKAGGDITLKRENKVYVKTKYQNKTKQSWKPEDQ